MKSRPTIIANWKMYFSYLEVKKWLKLHVQELKELVKDHTFILCGSYESLEIITQSFKDFPIHVSGQNCSEYSTGAYTGQVCAQSLQEMGIGYCLIGHTETRIAFHETNEQLLKKLEQLFKNKITPIFCIGENKELHAQNRSLNALQKQLKPLLQLLENSAKKPLTCYIAYEPLWAIGTGTPADNEHILMIMQALEKMLKNIVNFIPYI